MKIIAPRIRTAQFLATVSITALLSTFQSGCATNSLNISKDSIGVQADLANPPKLINDPSDPKKLAWDRPSAFGPVQTEQQISGQKICSKLGKDIVPLGYNPKALDANGVAIKGGGFLCHLKQT